MIKEYRKKPVVIEAVQLTNDNWWEIAQWAHQGLSPEANAIISHAEKGIFVRTLEGTMHASEGDFIIKGVKGEFYPCKQDIFERTYEPK